MQKLVEMEFGSHVYGTNLPTSDRDYKGVFTPEYRNIVLGRGKETITTCTRATGQLKNGADDIDAEFFSLKQYMKLLLDGQTVALTMLFCPSNHVLSTSASWEFITRHKQYWLHKGTSAFAGYCRQQANKYGIKGSRVAAARKAMEFFAEISPRAKLHEFWLPILAAFVGMEHCEFLSEPIRGSDKTVRMLSVCNKKVQENITAKEAHAIYSHLFNEYGQRALAAEKHENVDWKALMHAVRVAGEAHELLTEHTITYPRPNCKQLLAIRKGEMEYAKVADIIEQGLLQLEADQKTSTLPDKPDHQFAEDFIYNIYSSQHFSYLQCDELLYNPPL